MRKTINIKQAKTGLTWGNIKLLYQHVGSYITGINLLVSLATLSLVTMIADVNILLLLLLFVVLMLSGVFILIVEYKYSMPSWYAANNKQVWEHQNPQRDFLEKMKQEILDEIRNNRDIPKDV